MGRALRGLWPVAVLAWRWGAGLRDADRAVGTGPGGAALGAWVIAARPGTCGARTGRGGNRLGRLTRLPRADWGKATAHTGLGTVIFAAAAMNAWVVEDIRVAQVGETFALGRYT